MRWSSRFIVSGSGKNGADTMNRELQRGQRIFRLIFLLILPVTRQGEEERLG